MPSTFSDGTGPKMPCWITKLHDINTKQVSILYIFKEQKKPDQKHMLKQATRPNQNYVCRIRLHQ